MNSAATQKKSTSAGPQRKVGLLERVLDLGQHALRREPLGELHRVLQHLRLGQHRRAVGALACWSRRVLGVVVEAALDVGVVVREHEQQHEREQPHRDGHADREQDGHRSPTTLRANSSCWNSAGSRAMPWSARRSENFGRIPVLFS